jgi:hypothetical protein
MNMQKGFLIVLFLTILTISLPTWACEEFGLTGIVEDNDLYIPVGLKSDGGITQEQFNSVLDKVTALYEPVIEEKGKKLQVIRKWDDGTVNAYAQQTGNVWKISMFGGLARHNTITADAFAMVACHELGHHLGGSPKKKSFWSASWASNEGQSDYWGAMKCMRDFIETDDNVKIMKDVSVPSYAVEKCAAVYGQSITANAACQRVAMAGLSLGNLFRALRNLETPLKFDTPDANTVRRTSDSHPAPQCRLDTYFHGGLCDKGSEDTVSDTDPYVGTCARIDNFENGIRPLCWFKPPRVSSN